MWEEKKIRAQYSIAKGQMLKKIFFKSEPEPSRAGAFGYSRSRLSGPAPTSALILAS